MKLTEVQRKALITVDRSPGQIAWHRRSTLEALRRRGLVARYTHFSIRAEWACGTEIVEQWRVPSQRPHDWEITPAGRAALEHEGK
ncbi:hypothetical protein ACWX0K_15145 [Nitrobacteraceae bacterium UC4446_H13]